MKDEEYIHEIQQLRNIKDISTKKYEEDLRFYKEYTGMTIEELLNEADNEEDQRIRMRKRKIKQHLLGFQQHQIDLNLQPSTIQTRMSRIKAFYRTYDIEVPQIKPPKIEKTETINDIPTIEHIRKAASTNNLKHRAIILFMVSGV